MIAVDFLKSACLKHWMTLVIVWLERAEEANVHDDGETVDNCDYVSRQRLCYVIYLRHNIIKV